jgi:hypothetical protein
VASLSFETVDSNTFLVIGLSQKVRNFNRLTFKLLQDEGLSLLDNPLLENPIVKPFRTSKNISATWAISLP